MRWRAAGRTVAACAAAVAALAAAVPLVPLVAPPGPAGAAGSPAASGSTSPRADLGPGQVLGAHQFLAMGQYHLLMQVNGNLVVTDRGAIIWQTHTTGHPGAYATLTSDGDFEVISSSGSAPLWQTGAAGSGTCLLGSATNGRLVVDTPGDPIGWWPLWTLAPCYEGTGAKVAVVGDSITLLSQGALSTVLGSRYSYDVSGMAGYKLAQQVPAELAMIHNPAGTAQDVIINLGTNDADRDNANWRNGLDQLLTNAEGHCTLLVNVSQEADRDSGVPGDQIALEINVALRAWARAHRDFHVLPWAGLLREDHDAWVGADGIHPNALGQVRLAQLYVKYLRRYCGG